MTSTPRSIEAGVGEAGRTAAAAFAAFRVGAGQMAAGWQVLAGRCLFYVLIMVVLSALWDKVAAEQVAGAMAMPGDLALYVGATEWITLSLPAIHTKFEDEIRGGMLEPHLLRPKPYLLMALAQSLGGALVRMSAMGATGIAMLMISGRALPQAQTFAYLAVLGFLALLVGMLLYAIAGLGAFWARRVLPFQLVIQKLMFLLGGLFAPISLYPGWLRALGEASPFAAHLYWAGAQVLRPSFEMFLRGVGWQVLWIGALSLVCAAMWRAGLTKVLRAGVV
jgi:ABC-2 type transport system permease protein